MGERVVSLQPVQGCCGCAGSKIAISIDVSSGLHSQEEKE